MNGQNSPAPRRASPTQADKPSWWKPWAAPGVILIALGLVAAGVGALFDIHKEIASVETDLGEKIHKEATDIRELVSGNAKAIGRLEGELSGLKQQVESMDRKLDRVLETRQGEAPPADPSVKHSQRR